MNKYQAVIIGFGKAGKTLAVTLAKAGWRVALIEQSNAMYGGTCINIGCIPTKTLVHDAQQHTDFVRAIQRKNEVVNFLRNKNFHNLADMPNIDVIDGQAEFINNHSLRVHRPEGNLEIHGEKIFINTGAQTVVPPIPGITTTPGVYDSTGLLNLKELPGHLGILGGGYIGVEFASMFANFGSKVLMNIVSDAGFKVPWYKSVEKLGWYWLSRVRGKVQYADLGAENWKPISNLHDMSSSHSKTLGYKRLTKSNPISCQILLYKSRSKGRKNQRSTRTHCHHPSPKIYSASAKEPWILATNLPVEIRTPKQLVNIYSKRMQIEETFRDLKSPAYGLGLRHSRTSSSERFDIMLLIALMLQLTCWLAGVHAQKQGWDKHFQANTVRNKTLPKVPRHEFCRSLQKKGKTPPRSLFKKFIYIFGFWGIMRGSLRAR